MNEIKTRPITAAPAASHVLPPDSSPPLRVQIKEEFEGRGLYQSNCPKCQGSGGIPPYPAPSRRLCENCSGSGRVWRLPKEQEEKQIIRTEECKEINEYESIDNEL